MTQTSQPQIHQMFTRKYLNRLIWPLVAEQFLAMTIGACDTVMVSSVGEAGVSGVSLVDQLSQLALQLFAAFATGGAVVASQYLGHKETNKACHSAKQLLNLSLFVGLLFIVICLPFRRAILNAIFGGTDASIMENALTYFMWVLLSFPLIGIYNCCAALCRSMGNSKISLEVSLVMNLTNIAGNALLIYVAKLGVTGAGISTLASRAIAAVVMCVILCRKTLPIHLEKIWKFEVDFSLIGKILKIAVPSAIENSVFHIGKILVYSFMSGFGITAIAANAISNTVASFSNIPGNAIGLASVTVVGQCIGAGEKSQAKSYGRKMMVLAYSGMFLTCLVVFAFAPTVVRIFNLSAESQKLASNVIRSCMVANVIFWPMSFVMPNILRGAGDAKYTMIISNISMWAFRVLGSFLISRWILRAFPENTHLALYGVWFGMYIDWAFRGLFFGLRFHGKRWLEKKVI